MTNILVTGGCGFIGSNLVDMLVKDPDNNVVVVDSLVTGKKKIVMRKQNIFFKDIRHVFKNSDSFKCLKIPTSSFI